MTTRHATQRTARWTGAAYLGIVICGIFAEFFVRSSLVVAADAATTADNIARAPGLFGLGIGADLLMIGLDLGVALGLYRLLRPVNHPLAVAATAFRVVQATILAANLLNLTNALELARRAAAGAGPEMAARALQAMETHALVYDVALIAFGLACLTLGRLLRRSRVVPRPLAVGLSLTGFVYLVGSFAAVFAPDLSPTIDPLYAIAIVVEPAFAAWLIVVGLSPGVPWRAPLGAGTGGTSAAVRTAMRQTTGGSR